MKRMTLRHAIQVVIRHAARDAAGTGCGIRDAIPIAERTQLDEALPIVWRRAYGFEMGEHDWFNLRLQRPR